MFKRSRVKKLLGVFKDICRDENDTVFPEAAHEDNGSPRGLNGNLHLLKAEEQQEDSKAPGNGCDVPKIIWDPGK